MSNEVFSFDVNEELHKIRANIDQSKINTVSKISNHAGEIVKKTSEISSISRISNVSASNQQFSQKDKVAEVRNLIRTYARYWGETEESIEEYIKDQLESYPLDGLLKCFRSLNADIQKLQPPLANVANTANPREK